MLSSIASARTSSFMSENWSSVIFWSGLGCENEAFEKPIKASVLRDLSEVQNVPKIESKSDDLPLPKGKHGRFSCPLLLPPSVGHPSWSNGHRTLLVDGNSKITSSFLAFPQKAKKILPFPQNFNLPPGGKTSTKNAPSLVRILSPTVYLIAMVIHHQSHPPHKSMRICVPPFFLPSFALLCLDISMHSPSRNVRTWLGELSEKKCRVGVCARPTLMRNASLPHGFGNVGWGYFGKDWIYQKDFSQWGR